MSKETKRKIIVPPPPKSHAENLHAYRLRTGYYVARWRRPKRGFGCGLDHDEMQDLGYPDSPYDLGF